ncbi:MAG: hypothetical protein DYG93_07510 [Leptolyngbya sp. PLA2]|nr:hypothetical protein [Leptolyngbya sp.]MCE7971495.1 hypothetical protein [Leptolyngbya sp. PL-A2]MCQ3940710.1 hypothetical protein [cyanobacterium CYA1]MCZ7632294.1 hypothetical protein [Phycisphaerales bacterium]MDL1903679.1 hypothetical protein [Synechococcales cyanobacterium CNB]GIK18430.1 MAG: hypothetical protein BroJett004_05940 [Planctomycetota bacterium]
MSESTVPESKTATPTPTRTTLARRWLIRVVLITIALWAFGAWGLYDALVAYPKRGAAYAELMQLEYLRTANDRGVLGQASIDDPAGELARLRAKDVTQRSAVEQQRLLWLEALATPGLNMLDPQHTRMENPGATLARLQSEWAQRPAPKPLSWFDLPSQWLILVVCWGFGTWMLILFGMVASKRYSWEPEAQRLTLPGGATLVPADLDDVDKRKWHKFIVFLKIKPEHVILGGRELRLDLFRYNHLESWVLEMEKTAFPDRQEEEEEAADGSAPDRGDGPRTEPDGAGA